MHEMPMDSPDRRLYCSFWLGEHRYGIDTLSVREVSAQTAFTPIPLAPASVRGFVNLRGQLYLAHDMRVLLGMRPLTATTGDSLFVFKPAAGESFAVYVDRIGDIVEVKDDQIDRPADDIGKSGALPLSRTARLVSGVAKLDTGLMTIVDPCRILAALSQGSTE